jgi:aminoglycoside phosphotransferase (APT) family kinase protein
MGKAEELSNLLAGFLSEQLGRNVGVEGASRMSGGASREIWSFSLVDGNERRDLVLRRDPPGAPSSSSRSSEIEILRRAFAAGVPVPEVLWAGEGDELGSPGFIMNHIEGETIARRILRDDTYAGARETMAAQCGEILAGIHSIDSGGIDGLAEPKGSPVQAIYEQYTNLLDSFGEPHPAFELALRWLRQNMPASNRSTLVHGDFRNGNFIVGPEGVRAVLDWELVHIGDPWEDLAWLCTRSWRFGEAGEVGGFGDRADLYEAYESASGIPVDADAVQWWEIMSNVKWGVMTMAQAFTHLWGHVESLELAAIGRRTVETEYDVLNLIRGGLRGGAGREAPASAPRSNNS